MGRPTLYNDELADYTCLVISTHTIGIPRLCAKYKELPSDTAIYEWRIKHPEFAVKYAQAKLKQAELLAEEILDISDDSSQDFTSKDKDGNPMFNSEAVARCRLRVDTRKWLASKLLPKAYGNHKLTEELLDKNQEMMKELLELRVKLMQKNKKDY